MSGMNHEMLKCFTCGHDILIIYFGPPNPFIRKFELNNIKLDKCCKATWNKRAEEIIKDWKVKDE